MINNRLQYYINKLIFITPALISYAILAAWPYIGRSTTNSIKYLPVFLSFGVIGLFQIYKLFQYKNTKSLQIKENILPILLFSMYLIGSAYAIILKHQKITFLSQALVMSGFFYGFYMIQAIGSEATRKFVIGITGIIFFPISIGIALQEWGHGIPHHEFIYLCIPICFYLFVKKRSLFSSMVAIVSCFALMYFSGKNTTYILVLVSILLLVFLHYYKKSGGSILGVVLKSLVFVSPVILLGVYLWWDLYFSGQISTGNIGFRLYLYLTAMEKFMDSPVYGNFFTDLPVNDMRPYFGRFMREKYVLLPTHSDILDLLANGGILAFSVFLTLILRSVKNFFKLLLVAKPEDTYFYIFIFITVINILIIISINPVFNMPINGVLAWFYIGIFASLNYRFKAKTL